jgi:hypothetical protein
LLDSLSLTLLLFESLPFLLDAFEGACEVEAESSSSAAPTPLLAALACAGDDGAREPDADACFEDTFSDELDVVAVVTLLRDRDRGLDAEEVEDEEEEEVTVDDDGAVVDDDVAASLVALLVRPLELIFLVVFCSACSSNLVKSFVFDWRW